MSNTWLHRFESRLNRLETAAAAELTDPAQVLPLASAALQTLVDDPCDSFLIVRSTAPVTGPASGDVDPATETVVERIRGDGHMEPVTQELATSAMSAAQSGLPVEDHDPEGERPSRLSLPRPVAHGLTAVLDISYAESLAPHTGILEGMAAVLEIITAVIARHLVSQYEQRLQVQSRLLDLINRLNSSPDLNEAASVIAQEAPAGIGQCRIGVFVFRGGHYQPLAITGVQHPRPDSEVVRAIGTLAASSGFQEWHAVNKGADGDLSALAVLEANGTRNLRVLPVEDSPGVPLAALTIELQHDQLPPEEIVIQQLADASAHVLTKLSRQQKPFLSRYFGRRRTAGIVCALALIAFLSFWPATLELEVPGQIVATNHRRIFAPESGIIDEVFFKNEQTIAEGAPLIHMTNADLDLELRRLRGEVDTTLAELSAVTAKRLAGDPELSSQEARLEQKLAGLKAERELVSQRARGLSLTAPFAGRVFQHSSQQDLKLRPVQRGQLLMEIIPNDDQWHLELSIPDHLDDYVRGSWTKDNHSSVRYLIRSAPKQQWKTSLTQIDDAVQNVTGTMTRKARAPVGDLPSSAIRPGTTVTARINCGRRSIGFVWFREVIEFCQHLQFAWF